MILVTSKSADTKRKDIFNKLASSLEIIEPFPLVSARFLLLGGGFVEHLSQT